MDRSCVIQLVRERRTKDEYGVDHTERTARNVFAQVDSVTRAEFFEGGRNGLNPEMVFRVFFGDYNDERELVYEGMNYGIYRVYKSRNDTVELYAERKGGLNATSAD